jgi:putative membrane protein
MSTASTLTAFILSVSAIASVQAQQPAPTNQSPDPAAASSPHQRSATKHGAAEAATGTDTSPAAASSPHQEETASPGSSSGRNATLARTDRDGADPAKFVTKAAEGGLTEVALAKAAKASSQDPKIKQFADQMLHDHGQANDELTRIAKSKGLAVPTSLDAEHQAILQKLSNKKGAEFDSAYSKQMQMDHEKTIALFRGGEQSSDPDLAAFAKKTLPTLTEHEKMANSLPGSTRTASSKQQAGEARP